MLRQLAAGSVLLLIASALHIAVLVTVIEALPSMFARFGDTHWPMIFAAFAAILVGHTIQIWIWALVLIRIKAIDALENAIYFTLVTSTTLGYGDITLGARWRLFGAMAAVNGLLTFGLSTAFLIEVFAKTYAS